MAEDKAHLCCSPTQISSRRRAFKERYMSRLLPAVKLIQERRREAAPGERVRAIRRAADMSLAMTAAASSLQGGRLWSRALLQDLSYHHHRSSSRLAPSVTHSSRRARSIKSRTSGRPLTYLAVLKRSRRTPRRCLTRPSGHGGCLISDYAGSDHGDCSLSEYADCSIPQAQIRSLRQLIPGGSSMDAPSLLTEAADYIASLQLQIEAMASLAHCGSLSSLPQ